MFQTPAAIAAMTMTELIEELVLIAQLEEAAKELRQSLAAKMAAADVKAYEVDGYTASLSQRSVWDFASVSLPELDAAKAEVSRLTKAAKAQGSVPCDTAQIVTIRISAHNP